MLDLYELGRLFNNWLRKKKSSFSCELVPRFKTFEHYRVIEVEIYRIDGKDKDLISTISSSGKDVNSLWDKIFDKMFAYFMEIGKNVE